MTDASTNSGTNAGPMLAADGRPLKASLARALRRQKLRALMLIAPLLIFVVLTFVSPIVDMLLRSIDNKVVGEILPQTVVAIQEWDPESGSIPDEPVFEALAADLKVAFGQRIHMKVGQRLNYELPGISGLFRKTGRPASRWEEGPYKEKFLDVDDDWGDLEVWHTMHRFSGDYTTGYFEGAADLMRGPDGSLQSVPEEQAIYLKLFIRTLWLSITITLSCLLLGYPIAWLLSNLKVRTSNLLLILVLLPFWTSLLVRTSAWKVLLQQEGVINDLLSWFYSSSVGSVLDYGITFIFNVFVFLANIIQWVISLPLKVIGDSDWGAMYFDYYSVGFERLVMINNQTGTIIAMTHILLPFMILPLYSVMKTIPPTYLRAAKSMGATNWTAFWRVYFPNSIPGIGAGSILVFILAIGYYITPELVGGNTGTFISNRIAYNISSSGNWGLAAALGVILLVVVMGLYWCYDKIVGIDNVKLG